MTTAAQPVAVDSDERTDARALTIPLVGAQVLQNVLGGILIGNAVAALMWMAGADLAATWRIPVGIGWFVAGAAGIRAFADEFRADRRWRKREREHEEEMTILSDALEEVEAERDRYKEAYQRERTQRQRLENDNAGLRYQVNAAHAKPGKSIPVPDLFSDQMRDDARMLLKLWYDTNAWPGERTSGLTRTRHKAARDLLERAKIANDANTGNAGKPPETYAWAQATLEGWLGRVGASTPHRGLEVDDAGDAVNAEAGEG